MIDLSDSLENLIREIRGTSEWKEGVQLEFKKGSGGFPKDAWSTYSAFANTEGGLLIIGVDDDGKVTGISNPEQIKKDFIDTANNLGKVSYNLIQKDDVVLLPIEDATILVARIRRASSEIKPLFINNKETECYRRNGSADQRCTDELRYQMIRDKIINPHGSRVIPYTSLNDLDTATINQYRNLMKSVNAGHPWLQESDEGLLRKVGAYATNRETMANGATVDGLLMFGTDEALRELFPQYKVEYYELLDAPTIHQRWLDRIYIDGTWQPNLFQFYQRVRNKLEQNVKRSFTLSSNAIRQDDSLAHIAIREALANSIIHADYTSTEGIRIEQSSQGIRLRNAGTLLLPKDTILQGGHSKCRNPILQNMFALIGVSEKAGSGVDKLLRGWLDEYIAEPTVHEHLNPINVEWILPYAGLAQRKILNHIQNTLGEPEYGSLDFWQKLMLLRIPDEKWISRKELANIIPIHPADISQYLTKLVKEGHIVTKGKSSATRYQKHSKFLSSIKDAQTEPIVNLADSSAKLAGDDILLSFSEELQARISEYRTKKRHPRELTDQLVIDITHERWVSLSTLSKLLYLKASVINRDVVQPLIRSKRMKSRYPQSHPRQEFQSMEVI